MHRMTERSAKWMESVKSNFAAATGRPVEAWVDRARKLGLDKDIKEARKWLKEKQGLTMVQANYVLTSLFPEPEDEEQLVAAQYSGKKAALRPIYDRLAEIARKLGADVQIFPRKSQVTFARHVTFAVVRAATKDRVDLSLRLAGIKPTRRLVANPQSTGSDPTHTLALGSISEVDGEIANWLALAYQKAAR